MVNPCYQYLPSAGWAKINSGAILLLSEEELWIHLPTVDF